VLTLSPEDASSDLPKFEAQRIRVDSLSVSRYAGLVQAPTQLRSFCRSLEPSLVHTQGIRPDLLSAVFLGAYPRLATQRNYPYEDYPAKYGMVKGGIASLVHMAALRRIDVPVACSHAVRRKVEPHGIESTVIQNGVDAAKYRPTESEAERRELRTQLGLPQERSIFVSVGFLIPRKDPDCVIKGFARSDWADDGVLLMLGDGPLLESSRQAAKAANADVRLPGFVDNVAPYLRASDYFVSASHSEGLPNTVMEAFACGLPAVLSDIPAHREILERSSEPARMFDTGDTAALTEALNQMTSDNRAAQRKSARALVEAQFTAEHVSQGYQDLYGQILSTSGIPT
jgi:glycosyltransferase involved in cell wall biosynthesis